MRDPFRPNSNNQLIREAQIAFVVIALLLGLLVYVAIHRVTGKRFYFQRIAQKAPLAEHINDNAYPAHTVLDQEERVSQAAANGPQRISQPEINNSHRPIPIAKPAPAQTFSPRRKPKPTPIPTKPAIPAVSATDASPPASASIAQAQFIETPKPQISPASKKQPAVAQPAAAKPAADDPFEKMNSLSFVPVRSSSQSKIERDRTIDAGSAKRSVSDVPTPEATTPDAPTAGLSTPPIRSNFGAGSTRDLPSFDSPAELKPTEKAKASVFAPSKSPAPRAEPTPPQAKSFVPPQKPVTTFTPLFKNKKVPSTKITQANSAIAQQPEKRIPKKKPQPLGPDEYRVQPQDSLWSIALDHYGDGRFFRALHQHNLDRIASADKLQPNTTLIVPNVDQLIKRYAELCPADQVNGLSHEANGDDTDNQSKVEYDSYEKKMGQRFHITQSGDTLFDVARQRLGQASRYLEIFELNRFRIPQHANHLTPLDPGLRLLLPE